MWDREEQKINQSTLRKETTITSFSFMNNGSQFSLYTHVVIVIIFVFLAFVFFHGNFAKLQGVCVLHLKHSWWMNNFLAKKNTIFFLRITYILMYILMYICMYVHQGNPYRHGNFVCRKPEQILGKPYKLTFLPHNFKGVLII